MAWNAILAVVFVLGGVPPATAGSSLYAPLHGQVVDPEGAPIEGARVEAFRVHRKPGTFMGISRPQLTPGDGTFRFEDLPTGTEWHLAIRRKGWAQDEDPDYRIASGGTRAVVVLHPEKPIVLRVRCAETGNPIPAAVVRVGHGRIVLPAARTGKGEWTVRAASGRIPLNVSVASRGYHGQTFRREAGATEPLTVHLKPTGDIDVSGVAVDAKGRPVPRATVFAVRESREEHRRHFLHALTDARGRFTLVRLMGREKYRIWALDPKPTPDLVSEWIYFVPRKGLTLRLEMIRTGRIGARIVAPAGHPAPTSASARVHRSDRPDMTQHYSATSFLEKNGAFQASGNPPGVYDLVIRPYPYPEILVSGVKVVAGRTTTLGTLTATPGTELTVHLKDPLGRTGDDYRIRLLGPGGHIAPVSALRMPDGSVVRGQVPAGTWRIVACAKKEPRGIHDLGEVTVKAEGPQVVEKNLPATGRILVRVIDAAGRPVSDHAVDLTAVRPAPLDLLLAHGFRRDFYDTSRSERAERLWRIRKITTETTGEAETGPLAPGEYRVTVGTEHRTVTVPPGGTVVVEFIRT